MKANAGSSRECVYVKKPLNILVPSSEDKQAQGNPFSRTLKIGTLKPGTSLNNTLNRHCFLPSKHDIKTAFLHHDEP